MDSIARIQEYAGEMSREDFLQSKIVQDAVIRNFEIIGEAVKNLSPDFRKEYSEIEWRKIAGMRDKLIHDYIGVDLWSVWGVIVDILPDFKRQLTELN